MSSRVAKAGATKFKPVRPAPKKPPNPAAVAAVRSTPAPTSARAPSASPAPLSTNGDITSVFQQPPSQATLDAYAEDDYAASPGYNAGTQSTSIPDLSFTQSTSITATQDGPASPGKLSQLSAVTAPEQSKGTSFSFSSSLDAFEASHGGDVASVNSSNEAASTRQQRGTTIAPSLPPGETRDEMPPPVSAPTKRKTSPFKPSESSLRHVTKKQKNARAATPVAQEEHRDSSLRASTPQQTPQVISAESPSRNIDPSLLGKERERNSAATAPDDDNEPTPSTSRQPTLPPLPPGRDEFDMALLDEIRAHIDVADAQQAADPFHEGDVVVPLNQQEDEDLAGSGVDIQQEAAAKEEKRKGDTGKGKGKKRKSKSKEGDAEMEDEDGAPAKKKKKRASKKTKDVFVDGEDVQGEGEGAGEAEHGDPVPAKKKERVKKVKDPNAPEKPKKQRKKKVDTETTAEGEAAPPKKKRGRPKKDANATGGKDVAITNTRRRNDNGEDDETQPPGLDGNSGEEEEADQGIFPDDPLAPLDPSRVPLQALIKDIDRGSISNWMAQKLEKKEERRQRMKAVRDRRRLQVSLEKEGKSPDEIRQRLEEEFPDHEVPDEDEVVESRTRRIAQRQEDDEEQEQDDEEEEDGVERPVNHDIDLSQYNFTVDDEVPDDEDAPPIETRLAHQRNQSEIAEEDNEQEEDEEGLIESTYGPQIKMVNGEMVIDESSTQIQRDENAMANYEVVEIKRGDKRVTSYTHGRAEKRKLVRQELGQKGGRWTVAETDLFYEGLHQFGTDFELIAGMFPYRDRRQIKSKWVREEKAFPDRIDRALMVKKKVNLEYYEEVNKIDFTNGEIPADPMHRYYEGLPTLEEAIKLESNRAGSNESELPRKKEESNRPMEEGHEEEEDEGEEGAEAEEEEEQGDEPDLTNRPLFNPDSDEEAGSGAEAEQAEEGVGEAQEDRAESEPIDFAAMGGVQIKSTA